MKNGCKVVNLSLSGSPSLSALAARTSSAAITVIIGMEFNIWDKKK